MATKNGHKEANRDDESFIAGEDAGWRAGVELGKVIAEHLVPNLQRLQTDEVFARGWACTLDISLIEGLHNSVNEENVQKHIFDAMQLFTSRQAGV